MRKKLTAMARRWDSDGDGFVDEQDYAVAAGRMATLAGFDEGSAEFEQLHHASMAGWELLRTFDADGDDRLSIGDWLGGFEAIHADPDRYRQVVVEPAYDTFDLIDTDQDGRISWDEHQEWLRALSLPDLEIAVAYDHIDPYGDGFVDREAFVRLVDEFFTSDDPEAPGTWLFGPP